MKFAQNIYGPGPVKGSGVLLAAEGVEYTPADLDRMGLIDPDTGELRTDADGNPIGAVDDGPEGDLEADESTAPDESTEATPERAALEARAAEFDIPVGANWKDDTIRAKIAEAEAAANTPDPAPADPEG